MSGATRTWADGFGVWHARVPRAVDSPVDLARWALREELLARAARVDPRVWLHPERVPEMSDDTTVVFREADLTTLDEPDRPADAKGVYSEPDRPGSDGPTTPRSTA